MCSGYPLVSSKLAKILGFKGYLTLPLTPTPRSKRELGYSHVNAQNEEEGVRQRIGIHPLSETIFVEEI